MSVTGLSQARNDGTAEGDRRLSHLSSPDQLAHPPRDRLGCWRLPNR